ncbi:unnamed protein product [Echinostoma caproni]|uniref:Uncharacterized protein n=1 Tax=Echinostoma caproni TaxID=27848 RepID=A0A183A126_9TREM|nr:unnamed protein product [Echinostoma caproni]
MALPQIPAQASNTPSPSLPGNAAVSSSPQCNVDDSDNPVILGVSHVSISTRSSRLGQWGRSLLRPSLSRNQIEALYAAEKLAFKLLSSHHFVPANHGLQACNPHWITLAGATKLA